MIFLILVTAQNSSRNTKQIYPSKSNGVQNETQKSTKLHQIGTLSSKMALPKRMPLTALIAWCILVTLWLTIGALWVSICSLLLHFGCNFLLFPILAASANICQDMPSSNKIERDQPNDRRAKTGKRHMPKRIKKTPRLEIEEAAVSRGMPSSIR